MDLGFSICKASCYFIVILISLHCALSPECKGNGNLRIFPTKLGSILVNPHCITHSSLNCWLLLRKSSQTELSLSLSLLWIPLRFDDSLHLHCLPNKPIEKYFETWSEGQILFSVSNIAFGMNYFDSHQERQECFDPRTFPFDKGGFCGESGLLEITRRESRPESIVLHCFALFCTILHCCALYCIVLHCFAFVHCENMNCVCVCQPSARLWVNFSRAGNPLFDTGTQRCQPANYKPAINLAFTPPRDVTHNLRFSNLLLSCWAGQKFWQCFFATIKLFCLLAPTGALIVMVVHYI